jgi:hypothetical protein
VSVQVEFDLEKGRDLRDEGMALASKELFKSKIMAFIEALPPEWEGLFEDIRKMYVESGAALPESANAWGAMANAAQKKGLLEKTGKWDQSRSVASHARLQPVLRRVR